MPFDGPLADAVPGRSARAATTSMPRHHQTSISPSSACSSISRDSPSWCSRFSPELVEIGASAVETTARPSGSHPAHTRKRGSSTASSSTRAVSGTSTTVACTTSGWTGSPKTVSGTAAPAVRSGEPALDAASTVAPPPRGRAVSDLCVTCDPHGGVSSPHEWRFAPAGLTLRAARRRVAGQAGVTMRAPRSGTLVMLRTRGRSVCPATTRHVVRRQHLAQHLDALHEREVRRRCSAGRRHRTGSRCSAAPPRRGSATGRNSSGCGKFSGSAWASRIDGPTETRRAARGRRQPTGFMRKRTTIGMIGCSRSDSFITASR